MSRWASIDKRLITILLIVFVQFLGASMALPVLPLFAKNEFTMSAQTITILISSFFAAQFLAGPFIGRLSDQYGRLPVLIVSQIGTVISFIMLVLAQSPGMLFASRILDGVTGGNIVVAQAYITDVTPRSQRTHALGMIFAAFGLGFIFGPALGGILSAGYGPRIPFLIASIAAAATVILTWITLDESNTAQQREANRLKGKISLSPSIVFQNYPLMLVLVTAFCAQLGFGMLQSTFALFGEAILFADYDEGLTNLGIGLLLSVIGVGQLITQLFLLRRMLKRFGEVPLVLIGTVLRAFSMIILIVIVSPWLGIPSMLLFAIGSGLMMPALQSLVTNTVDDALRGSVLGLYQSSISLSVILSTAGAGSLFAISPRLPYWLATVLFFSLLIPGLFLLRWSRNEEAIPAGAQD